MNDNYNYSTNLNQPPRQPQRPVIPPKTWLLESILVTLFCCLPFGIVGIVYASKVESLWSAGRYDLAEQASRDAKKWVIWGVIAAVAVAVLYIVFWVVLFGMGITLSELANR